MRGLCVVIVTYKDRISYVNRVINAAIEQGANHVVVVANGTPKTVLEGINQKSRISIVAFSENHGSGFGFREGIKKGLETKCEFFLLLDDDNLPEPDCLALLDSIWHKQSKDTPPQKLLLSCFRKDQFANRDLHINGNKIHLQPFSNSCHGFHIKTFFSVLIKRLFTKKWPAEDYDAKLESSSLLEADGAFFGGMYFHKDLLQLIGLPSDHYFIYADDLEFSHRVISGNGKIMLVKDAVIYGLDHSIPLTNRMGKLYHSTLDYKDSFRTYYCSRNVEYLTRKYFVSSKPVYYLNVFLFVGVISIMSLLRGKVDRLGLVIQGITDSWMGKMGKTRFLNNMK